VSTPPAQLQTPRTPPIRYDFFERFFANVNPLALGAGFLGLLALVYAASKAKEAYNDHKSRIAKSEFAEDTVELTAAGRRGRGGSGGGGGEGSVLNSIRFGLGGGGGGGPSKDGHSHDAHPGEGKAEGECKAEGRLFLEAAGLGAFWGAFEASAVTSVDDLCDSSLITDHELIKEVKRGAWA